MFIGSDDAAVLVAEKSNVDDCFHMEMARTNLDFNIVILTGSQLCSVPVIGSSRTFSLTSDWSVFINV